MRKTRRTINLSVDLYVYIIFTAKNHYFAQKVDCCPLHASGMMLVAYMHGTSLHIEL